MAGRNYGAAPISDRLGIDNIIEGLAQDLAQLRTGEISIADAQARAMLAKQIFNGFRLYLNAASMLSARATVAALDSSGPIVAPEPPCEDTTHD